MNHYKTFSLTVLTLAVSQVLALQVQAAEFDRLEASQTDFGGAGLLQMPSARMADTGEFSANYRDNDQYRRWSISIQPYDWLETTVRYTDVRTQRYSDSASFSGNQTYKDKGIDFKARLWQESMWLPQVSAGVRDIAGTGLFDGEFVVANKRWGDFDFALGVGWGNVGQRSNISNPFCKVSDSWCLRDGSFSGRGGNFQLNKLFHGPAAIFGGIEYQTPWQPLRLKLEYDGNDYSHEFAGTIKVKSPVNVGAVYRVTDMLDTQVSYERGNTLMWGVTLRTNFNSMRNLQLDHPREKVQPAATSTQKTDWQQVASRLESNAGWTNPTIYSDDSQVHMLAEQKKYRNSDEANARAAAIVANATTANVKTLIITRTREQMPISEQKIDLQAVRDNTDRPLGQEAPQQASQTTPTLPRGVVQRQGDRPRFNWSWAPHLAQSFGGPENFYMYQVSLTGSADLALTNHFWGSASTSLNVANNYNQFNYKTPPSDTNALPRVRTWIREYVTSSDLLLTNLQLTEMDKLSDSVYWQAYGGYLEMMYAGVGSEVLYRPFGKSWAIGMDANYVRQRDWNNTMKLADYTVGTGHVTGYWNLPYIDNTLLKLSVGRYLAKDIGATVDLSRKFDSGVVAGAFATFTNVSADEYGEGSFTKGFYITIPFDLLLVKPTTSTGSVSWIPLTRDGGQMLSRKYGLYTLSENN